MRCRRGTYFLLVCRIFLSGTLMGQVGRSLHTLQHTPSEIGLHELSSTLTGWSSQQIRDFPALRTLQAAGSQDELPIILDGAGKTAAAAYQELPRISCDEALTSEIGSPPKTKHQWFRYMVFPGRAGDVDSMEEYRADPERNLPEQLNLRDLFMISSGFASTLMYFGPDQRRDSHFRDFGTQWIRSRKCHVVGFAQDPERARNVGEVRIGGKDSTVYLQGLAWIDSQSFQTLRIMIWPLPSCMNLDLSSLNATIDFYPVQPNGSKTELWLPRDVKVLVLYRGTPVRNIHHYSNFKLFRVDSTIKP
jgi:hypothetical protein